MKDTISYKALSLSLLILMYCLTAHTQVINGYWQGRFRTDQRLSGRSEIFYMKMELKQQGRKIEGQFYTAPLDFPESKSVLYQISGRLGKKDSVPAILMRDRILYSRIPDEVAEYFLSFEEISYSHNDTMEILQGNWRANGLMSLRSDGYAGSFWVSRPFIKDSLRKISPQTSDAVKVPVPEQMAQRQNEVQGSITVNTKKIRIELYDNGVTDGDTVSIFFNGKLLLSHQHITEKPITLDVELDEKAAANELVLFAENLGSIPPNTALVIVSAGKNRYDLFSSADLHTNALLQITYRPDQ